MDDDGLAAPPANASAYATFVQYGDVRSASTFQFMAVCLLAHLAHGLGTSSRRRVACRFAGDVTAASLATLRRGGTESDDVVVVKTHRLNGVGRTCVDGCDPREPRWGRAAPAPAPAGSAVPASLLFVSVRAGSARAQLAAAGPLPPAMRLAAVQRYETLERGGLAALDAYAPLFPAVAPARFALLREYLGHWQILRRCCGVQASQARTDALHGLPPRRPDACAGRDLDAVEEALFNTSLWRWRFADARGDFFPDERARVRRGVCCYSTVALRNGAGFRGKWRPDADAAAYLEAHGDPRDAPADADAACRHRNFQSTHADPVKCLGADGRVAACPRRERAKVS